MVGVVCQPDRPAGRGLQVRAGAVKLEAMAANLPVFQPEKVRSGELRSWLEGLRLDLAVVLAYGRILPLDVLQTPRLGSVNLHASLLPKLRGAAPIQWAILTGETSTGVSLMQMRAGLDTGPVFSRHPISIGPDETGGELAGRLAELAGDVVTTDLPRLLAGDLIAVEQEHALATHAPPLERRHAAIDWSQSSRTIHAQVRALAPRPGAQTTARGKRLRVTRTRTLSSVPHLSMGEVRVERPRVVIGTGDGGLELISAQIEGRRELSALELVAGRALSDGDRLGSANLPP